jgi:hypothetical protein
MNTSHSNRIDWTAATPAVLEYCGVRSRISGGTAPDPIFAGITTDEAVHLETLELRTPDGREVGVLAPPRITTRAIPPRGDAPPPSTPRNRHPLLDSPGILVPIVRDTPKDWSPALHVDAGGTQIPVAWRTTSGLRISTALRDGLAWELAFPPLFDGFYERENPIDTRSTADWIGKEMAAAAALPFDPPPPVITLRLDYDRAIETAEIRTLMSLLSETGISASCGFLLRREEDATAAMIFEDHGHEILLHTEAGNRETFLDECDRFEGRFGRRPSGYTAHGGRGSAGYLGQRQWEWAIEAGMIYGEMLGRQIHRMHPLLVVDAEGVARPAGLCAPGVHHSLDVGMKPDAHDLDGLLETTKAAMVPGGHVVIMNHPDLHRGELRTLLEACVERRPESATFESLAAARAV